LLAQLGLVRQLTAEHRHLLVFAIAVDAARLDGLLEFRDGNYVDPVGGQWATRAALKGVAFNALEAKR
jgi:hypothetical protein